jgi:hypothetical protein
MINYIGVPVVVILLNILSCGPDTEQQNHKKSNITTNPEIRDNKKKEEKHIKPLIEDPIEIKDKPNESENSEQKIYKETLIKFKEKLERKMSDYSKELESYKNYNYLKEFFANYTSFSINYDMPSEFIIEKKEKQLNASYLDKLKKYKLFIASTKNFNGLPVSTDDWTMYLKYESLRDKLSHAESIQKGLHWQELSKNIEDLKKALADIAQAGSEKEKILNGIFNLKLLDYVKNYFARDYENLDWNFVFKGLNRDINQIEGLLAFAKKYNLRTYKDLREKILEDSSKEELLSKKVKEITSRLDKINNELKYNYISKTSVENLTKEDFDK